jgi:integrase
MSRPGKGARLWLRPERRNTDSTLRERAVWVIRDGPRKVSTGCLAEDRASAERALGEYLANKYQPNPARGCHPTEVLIADVLTIYLTDIAPRHAREDETKQRVLTLDAWWADKTLAEVNGANCRAYVENRTRQCWKSAKPEKTGTEPRMVTAAAGRRELEDLRAAINHHRREGLCSEIVSVVLPPRTDARERWLTRSEAARLLWAAWRARQVMRDNATLRSVGRFILVGLYTGTRSAAICGAALMPTVGRGHVDLEQGVFYRRAIGRRQTKKRQPPVKLPPRLRAHMRRCAAKGLARKAVVEWNGKPVDSVRKGFAAAARAAGLGEEVTPHILRHTCAEASVGVAVDDLRDGRREVGVGIDAVELAGLDQRSDHGPMLGTAIGAREQCVLAIKCDRLEQLRLNQSADGCLDRSLSPRGSPELDPCIVEMEINGSFRQLENFGDLNGRLAARHPCQRVDFPIVQHSELRPYLVTGDAGQSRIDDHVEPLEVDRLGDIIVRPQATASQLVLARGHCGEKYEGYSPKPRGEIRQALQHVEPGHHRHVDVTKDEVRHLLENGDQTFVSIVSCESCKVAIGEFFHY